MCSHPMRCCVASGDEGWPPPQGFHDCSGNSVGILFHVDCAQTVEWSNARGGQSTDCCSRICLGGRQTHHYSRFALNEIDLVRIQRDVLT